MKKQIFHLCLCCKTTDSSVEYLNEKLVMSSDDPNIIKNPDMVPFEKYESYGCSVCVNQ